MKKQVSGNGAAGLLLEFQLSYPPGYDKIITYADERFLLRQNTGGMNMEEKSWVAEYSRELDKKKRKEILDAAIEAEGMTPEAEVRSKLWEARYGQRPKETTEVDHYIRGWMTMHYLKHASKGMFRKKAASKEKAQIMDDWQVEMALGYGEVGEEALYQELCNMTRLYLKLCKDDKTYSSIILGLGRMKEASLVQKMARDVFTLAYEIPRQTGLEEDFRLFTKAATDTFFEVYPDDKGLLEAMIEGPAR